MSFFSAALATPAQAQGGSAFAPPPNPGLLDAPLPAAIGMIVTAALVLVAVLALAYLVYGGFKYMTAAGDERQIEEAKKAIVGAIIGLLVIGLALAIVLFVTEALAP